MTMSGISAIDAHPIASLFREIPGPALPVTARLPAYEKPKRQRNRTEFVLCLNKDCHRTSAARCARISIIEDQGVIG